MRRFRVKAAVIAAAVLSAAPRFSQGALTFSVDPNSPWPSGWYNAAVTDMQTVVNMYNAYGDFGNGNIYVYYDAGIPTEQSGYGGWGGSIGVGGTYPNVRVLLHESSHWLGTGTYSNWWQGPAATAMLQQFDGLGAVLNGDTQHYWPYGENYDSESSPINDARHVAMVYALRQDFGIGSTALPSTATNVTMTASDTLGTSGFNYPWNWSDGHFPQAGTAYSTGNYQLRTPAAWPSWTFAGDSLTVNNTNGISGGLLFKGVGTSSVVTFKNLILDGGYVRHASSSADLFQIAGRVTLLHSPTIDAAQGNISISAPIGGSGSLFKTGTYALMLSGNNTYSGSTTITAGTLRLSAPTPVASYSFANVSGGTVINDGTGGAAMNGTFNANGGTGSINTSGGPRSGLGALVLNGTGSTVDINSGITDLGGNGTWTLSAWIKTTQAGATILNKGNGSGWSSGYSTFFLGTGNNSGSGGVPDAVRWGGGWLASAAPVNDGTWHQITYTDAGGTKAIYVDGVLTSLSQNQFFNPDTGSMVRIGFSSGSESDGQVATNGALSGVQFFTSALSATQVQQLYSGALTRNVLTTTTDVSISSGATLDLNGVSQAIASLSGVPGSSVTLGGGTLTVGGSASTQFSGNISGSGTLVTTGTGTLTLSGSNSWTGGTVINAGATLAITSNTALPAGGAGAITNNGALVITTATTAGQISGNGRLTLGSPSLAGILHLSSNVGASAIGALAVNTGSKLDLAGSPLVVQAPDAATKAADMSQLLQLVNLGRTSGAGIISSVVSGNPNAYGIAVADNAVLKYTSYDGQQVTANSLLVVPALLGDANLDGHVDATDLQIVLDHFGTSATDWTSGNFDQAGTINLTDLSAIFNNLGSSLSISTTGGPTAVPEPASAALLAAAGLLLLKRRSHRMGDC